MVREVLVDLRADGGGWFVDCTEGLGGHSRAILEASAKTRVLGLDRDPHALESARESLRSYQDRFLSFHTDFKEVGTWARLLPEPPAGILVDLGLSGYQLRTSRGFSFRDAQSLDMRMDTTRGETARDFLHRTDEQELSRVLREYGEEMAARRIARAVLEAREEGRLESAADLAAAVERAQRRRPGDAIHPATRTFQAIRIHVNRELEGLAGFFEPAAGLLRTGGRIVVLAYHSLEDRIVKRAFRALSQGCICPPKLPACVCGREPLLRLVHARALRPSPQEVALNPAARSARLRAGERL
jgi:16S rRNA (cytosine1402-N4)-methyltransferase